MKLDANLFTTYQQQFTHLISLTTSAVNKTNVARAHAADVLKTNIIDFFIRVAKVDNLVGHVSAIQMMANMAYKFSNLYFLLYHTISF